MVILQTETKFNLIFEIIELFVGFPGESAGKESACNVGNLGLNPGLGRAPGEGNGYPLQYSFLEYSTDSPWSRKELDITEQLLLTFGPAGLDLY